MSIDRMQLSPKLLLIAIPGSVGLGVSIVQADRLPSIEQHTAIVPTEWKIQTVEPPEIISKSAHQLLLDRQKQLSNRDLSCDCNGCRVAAAATGIKIN
jgi:hypothetical protein